MKKWNPHDIAVKKKNYVSVYALCKGQHDNGMKAHILLERKTICCFVGEGTCWKIR